MSNLRILKRKVVFVESTTVTMATLLSNLTTALGTVQSDVMSALGVALPIALAVAGTIWVLRRVFRWFSGMANGGR